MKQTKDLGRLRAEAAVLDYLKSEKLIDASVVDAAKVRLGSELYDALESITRVVEPVIAGEIERLAKTGKAKKALGQAARAKSDVPSRAWRAEWGCWLLAPA